jgi:hypothetical protein
MAEHTALEFTYIEFHEDWTRAPWMSFAQYQANADSQVSPETREVLPQRGMALRGQVGMGTMVPPAPLLVAANRMVKPQTSGRRNRCPLGRR